MSSSGSRHCTCCLKGTCMKYGMLAFLGTGCLLTQQDDATNTSIFAVGHLSSRDTLLPSRHPPSITCQVRAHLGVDYQKIYCGLTLRTIDSTFPRFLLPSHTKKERTQPQQKTKSDFSSSEIHTTVTMSKKKIKKISDIMSTSLLVSCYPISNYNV